MVSPSATPKEAIASIFPSSLSTKHKFGIPLDASVDDYVFKVVPYKQLSCTPEVLVILKWIKLFVGIHQPCAALIPGLRCPLAPCRCRSDSITLRVTTR